MIPTYAGVTEFWGEPRYWDCGSGGKKNQHVSIEVHVAVVLPLKNSDSAQWGRDLKLAFSKQKNSFVKDTKFLS